jgi:hypothetical protein
MLHRREELYYIVDNFCKELEPLYKKYMLSNVKGKIRNRQTQVSLSEMLCLLIMFQSSRMRDFKSFYYFVSREMRRAFPNVCSYQRFIELMPRGIPVLIILLNCLYESCDGISFVDSSAIKVCHIKREKRHKVFKGIAKKSKSSMGWYYGFKLHVIVNKKGELISANFSLADVDDRQGLLNMCKNIFGDVIGDRGYIGQKLKSVLKQQDINLITRGRKNMKNHILSARDKALLQARNIVETVIGQLKHGCQIEHTRHRSANGLIINVLCALICYCFYHHKTSKNTDLCTKMQIKNIKPSICNP